MRFPGIPGRFLTDGNIFIALSGAVLYAGSMVRHQRVPEWEPMLFVFCSIFFLYNLQRLVLIRKEDAALSERQRLFIRFRGGIITAVILSAGMMGFYFLFRATRFEQIVFLCTGIISLAYFIPGVNLRKYGWLKPFLIGITWGFFISGISMESFGREMWVTCAERACFITSLAFLFDLRDVARDRADGIKTWPQMVDTDGTRKLSWFFFLATLFIAGIFKETFFPWMITAAIYFPLSFLASPERRELFFTLGIDGVILVMGLSEWLLA
ncbi:MAG: hypothetical protein IT233_02460 [Bacteroidia bacterium]|nr:hypothetical protein [Bacteroidia bacterium]